MELNETQKQEGYLFWQIDEEYKEIAKYQSNIFKWGLSDNFVIKKYRFNHKFVATSSQTFVRDLLQNTDAQNYLGLNISDCKSVECSLKKASLLNMNFIEELKSAEVVAENGGLKQIMPIYDEDREFATALQIFLVGKNEEGEMQPETATSFNNKYKDQLLVDIFRVLVLGGQYNQYEDNLLAYKETARIIYKTIVR